MLPPSATYSLAQSILGLSPQPKRLITAAFGQVDLLTTLRSLGWMGRIVVVDPYQETWNLLPPDCQSQFIQLGGICLNSFSVHNQIIWDEILLNPYRLIKIPDSTRSLNAQTDILHQIGIYLKERLWDYTASQYQEPYLTINTIKNAIHFGGIKSRTQLPNQSPFPIAVVAPGPSLTSAIPHIIANRDKMRLFSVDTALPILTKSNIIPDAVVSVDHRETNLRHFTHLPPDPIRLIADPSVFPDIPKLPSLRPYFYSINRPIATWVMQPQTHPIIVRPALSVTIVAIQVACQLTVGPILLFGVDLAYHETQFYADGTNKSVIPPHNTDIEWIPISNPDVSLSNRRMGTTPNFRAMAHWIGKFAASRSIYRYGNGHPIPHVLPINPPFIASLPSIPPWPLTFEWNPSGFIDRQMTILRSQTENYLRQPSIHLPAPLDVILPMMTAARAFFWQKENGSSPPEADKIQWYLDSATHLRTASTTDHTDSAAVS